MGLDSKSNKFGLGVQLIDMMKFNKPFLLFFLFFANCRSSLNPTFVRAVQEHKNNTFLVTDSLIQTFQDEMAKETRPEAIDVYQEIIDNLTEISHESDILNKYVWNQISEEELIKILQSNWKK